MKIIASTQNKEIRFVSKLQNSKGRKEQNKFMAEGLRTLKSLTDSKIKLVQMYSTQAAAEEAKTIAPTNLITLVSEPVLEKMCASTTPSGLLGIFEIPPKPETIQDGIVLAQISDSGNMGTLIRTTAAMKFKTVVLIEGCDPWSPKVVQASAGTIGMVDIFQLSWQELIEQKKELTLSALVVSGGTAPTKSSNLIVVGNEAHGLPENWIKDCQEKITLKMPGNTESLNAAIAGSIALYLKANAS